MRDFPIFIWKETGHLRKGFWNRQNATAKKDNIKTGKEG